MSNPVQISEKMIPISNASTSNTRDSSTERKRSTHRAVNSVKRRASSKDSPDRSSSRESSLESKDRSTKEPRGRKSLSADGRAQVVNSVENGLKNETVSKKRSRPKSLDLSTKALTNGEEDSFRSPHPLTPCNVAVKRRKGRPKETPPTLVAESPVEQLNEELDDQDLSQETEKLPANVKKKGRKGNSNKDVNTQKLKKQLALKTFDSGPKIYGSKIIKKTLMKSFKKLPNVKKNVNAVKETTSLLTKGDVLAVREPESSRKKSVRLTGIRNKSKLPISEPTETEIGDKDPDSTMSSPILSPEKRKAGRPPGARNKTPRLFSPKRNKSKSAAKASMENSLCGESSTVTESDSCVLDKTSEDITEMTTEDLDDMVIDASIIDTEEDKESEEQETADTVETNNSVNLPAKKQRTLHTAHFKNKRGVKSLAKLKKENTSVPRVKKKRVLISHATNSDITSLAHLAPNDLRRKLQQKLIEKLSGKRTKTPSNSVKDIEISTDINDQIDKSDISVDINDSIEGNENAEKVSDNLIDPENSTIEIGHIVDKDINADIQNLSALVEQKRFNKSESDIVQEQTKKSTRARKANSEQRDLSKFSDSESVCSELSTQSLGSARRSQEKQVYVLGEENVDSDDNTVRTRQRFEIIPGKKRKRTLSGEFDLLDEIQLRKQKKKAEQGDHSADESDTLPHDEVMVDRKNESPKVKKTVLNIAKRLQSNKNTKAYRAKMRRQSPFLNKKKKSYAFHRRKKLPISSKDTDIGANDVKDGLSMDEKIKEIELSTDVVFQDEAKDNDMEKTTEKIDIEPKESMLESSSSLKLDNSLTDKSIDIKSEVSEEDNIDKETISLKDEENPTLVKLVELPERNLFESVELLKNNVCESKELPESIELESVTIPENKVIECDTSGQAKKSEKVEQCQKVDNITESLETNESIVKSMLTDIVDTVLGLKSERSEQVNPAKRQSPRKSLSVEKELDAPKDKSFQLILEGVKESMDQEIPATETDAIIQSTEKVLLGSASLHPDGIARTPVAVRGSRGRRRRGRKPYKHLLLNNRSLHTAAVIHKKLPSKRARKIPSRGAHKSPTDSAGLTRTFELRQKISRSPLDNIALKQSIEESEYYKIEAQKAVRKEMKRAKRMSPSQETDIIPYEETTTEAAYVNQNESEDISFEEPESRLEMLLRECKPCSVLLTDFIRQLRLAGRRVTSEDETENDTEGSLSDGSPLHVPEIHEQSFDEEHTYVDVVDDASIKTDKVVNDSHQKSENTTEKYNDNVNEDDTVETKPDNLLSDQVTNLKSESLGSKNSSSLKNKADNIKPVKSRKSSITAKKSIPKSSDFMYKQNLDAQTASQSLDIPKIALHKPGPKSHRTSRKSVPSGSPRGRKLYNDIPQEMITESQTARKTVPPLKIKLKGGPRSRRKTYMVETIIDDQANFKVVKKRSKNKSGSRSESETEKGPKSHHHHKRKSRTPDMEKKSKTTPAPTLPVVTEAIKKTPKPTDAYEANFLQFIQNSQEQEQSKNASLLTKGKALKQLSKGKAYKVDAEGSLTVTASSHAETTTSTNTEKTVLSSNTEVKNIAVSAVETLPENKANNKTDAKELQFLCSYCDKMVFREKDYIIKHIKELHPGKPIVYKEMPYVITDSHIEYVNDKDYPGQENAFGQKGKLNPDDQDTTGQKGLDKMSVEADSTTEVDSAQLSAKENKTQSGYV